ncbi:hypothetical protein PENSPDRAFT_685212 [Peniophora sp. CONT]|nr:hypothetical protein PENSPDRAFT_685212 [Peniophora sp. CONT]
MLGLQSLKESSPVCPPLQSVVGGLLKLVETYEIMTQNKLDCQKLYERIDAIQDSLVVAWGDADPSFCRLSEAQLTAMMSFDKSIQCIISDVDSLVARFKHPLRRFILASQNKAYVSDCLAKLSQAEDDFRRTIELDMSRLVTCMHKSIVTVSEQSFERHLVLCSELHTQRILLSTSLVGLFA